MAMGELTLTTTLQRRGPAAAVVLIAEQVADIGEGKKAFPVQATIKEYTWSGRVARMGGDGIRTQVDPEDRARRKVVTEWITC